jgi:hypothetical protein
MVVIAVLAVTNLVTLALLLKSHGARFPNFSRPISGLTVVAERIPNEQATAGYNFSKVPKPSATDAATFAQFSLITSGPEWRLSNLHDGRAASGADSPDESFFFNDGNVGGRFMVDLNQDTDIAQINTYSWHNGSRGPQLYKLYARDSAAGNFDRVALAVGDPADQGWKYLASVDTRPKGNDLGGQYGVSIMSSRGSIGHYRYLLFDCRRTEEVDRWGNTFYSEVDVVARQPSH